VSCCPNNDGSKERYDCQKHHIKMCATSAQCKDPKLYCKFRPSCLIHFLEKEHARQIKNETSAGQIPKIRE
jgi:hypothetical protein